MSDSFDSEFEESRDDLIKFLDQFKERNPGALEELTAQNSFLLDTLVASGLTPYHCILLLTILLSPYLEMVGTPEFLDDWDKMYEKIIELVMKHLVLEC